jgi:hypothetical protein
VAQFSFTRVPDISVFRVSLEQAGSTRSSQAKCYPLHSVILRVVIIEMGKRLLTLSLAKPRHNTKGTVKNCEFLFMETCISSLINL